MLRTRNASALAVGIAVIVLAVAWTTAAMAQSLSGKYGGDECLYELDFRAKDVVYITTLGMSEVRGQYTIEGDKVSVTAPGSPSIVFTRKGNALQTPFMGETMVCTKLSAAGAHAPAAQTPADRAAAAFIRATIDSHWVKGPEGWTTQPQDADPLYRQFKELTYTIEPQRLSEAQRLNGADYRGTVTFKATPERSYRTSPQGWSDWEDGDPGTLGIERRKGEWRMWGVIGVPGVLTMSAETDLFTGRRPGPGMVPTGHDTLQAVPAVDEDADACDQFGPDYNANNICYETPPTPLTPTLVPVPADAAVVPRPAILLLKVSRDGRTLEARIYVPSNVATFNAAALDMAHKTRWSPALRDGAEVEAWVQWRFQPRR